MITGNNREDTILLIPDSMNAGTSQICPDETMCLVTKYKNEPLVRFRTFVAYRGFARLHSKVQICGVHRLALQV